MLGVARGTAKWVAGEQTVNMAEHVAQRIACHVSKSTMAAGSSGSLDHNRTSDLCRYCACATPSLADERFALGSNEAAARACGIATDRSEDLDLRPWQVLLLDWPASCRRHAYGRATPTGGGRFGAWTLSQLSLLAEAALSGGEGTILGSMIGALIMAFLRNGCQQVGWPNLHPGNHHRR